MKEYKFPEITQLDQLNEDSFEYSYSDYMKWRFQERVEIIMGKIFPMSAPTTLHQHIIGELFFTMYAFFKHTSCNVILSPIDVRLPVGKQGKTFKTVMQPDLCVICDKSKIVAQGIIGAPDLVVEILSPGEQWMLQYVLNENNLYELHKKHENLSRLESVIFLGLSIDVAAYKP